MKIDYIISFSNKNMPTYCVKNMRYTSAITNTVSVRYIMAYLWRYNIQVMNGQVVYFDYNNHSSDTDVYDRLENIWTE